MINKLDIMLYDFYKEITKDVDLKNTIFDFKLVEEFKNCKAYKKLFNSAKIKLRKIKLKEIQK